MEERLLAVINYNGAILVGEVAEWDKNELILCGALNFEPTSKEEGGMRFSVFPLGSVYMLPDRYAYTRLPKSLVPCYTLLSLDNKNHDICSMYDSFWQAHVD